MAADKLWLLQHTKKNINGEQVWSDPSTQENYVSLMLLFYHYFETMNLLHQCIPLYIMVSFCVNTIFQILAQHKLNGLVRQQTDGEIAPMTNDEMLIEVFGIKSGYF